MPVFVINADPTFDLPGIARRDGLDLFKDERLHLVDALGVQPHNTQIERLWGDWPPRLEGNRNNLRAEVERIVSVASAQREKNHVILLVLNEYAPTDPSQYISRDILLEIRQRIQGRDRHDQGVETAESAQNVWVQVFLRPSRDPELMAQRAYAENMEALVNNVFVSVFNGKESDRDASDFLTLRVLTELLLNEQEGRRFLQVGIQNAYPVMFVIGPTRLPGGGTSGELRWLLSETLDQLEARNAPPAGSTAISAPAARLGVLVTQLVAQAKEGVDVHPTVDTGRADQATAGLLESGMRGSPAEGDALAAILADVAGKAEAVRWRPADRFAQLRARVKVEVGRELGAAAHRMETWTRRRTEKLKAFSGINVEIGRTINDISRAAVGSRGNDIEVLQDLAMDVRRARDGLKDIAQKCREAMSGADGVTRRTSDLVARVAAARRAFEFELDQVPQLRSIAFYLALPMAGAIRFLLLALMRGPHRLLFAALALSLLTIVAFACATSLVRRRRKMRQAAADLREELDSWRKCSVEAFNQALRYQTSTLAIGWLTSIAEKLEEIEQSIQLRSDALQKCREILATNVDLGRRAARSDQAAAHLIQTSVELLQTFDWDKWIVEFLSGAKRPEMRAPARIVLADDGEFRLITVPGLEEPVAITIRTPQKVSAPSGGARAVSDEGERTMIRPGAPGRNVGA